MFLPLILSSFLVSVSLGSSKKTLSSWDCAKYLSYVHSVKNRFKKCCLSKRVNSSFLPVIFFAESGGTNKPGNLRTKASLREKNILYLRWVSISPLESQPEIGYSWKSPSIDLVKTGGCTRSTTWPSLHGLYESDTPVASATYSSLWSSNYCCFL